MSRTRCQRPLIVAVIAGLLAAVVLARAHGQPSPPATGRPMPGPCCHVEYPSQKCLITITPYEDLVDKDADMVEFVAGIQCESQPNERFPVEVKGTVAGQPQVINPPSGEHSGSFLNPYQVDPCYLSGGKDVPGTKVRLEAFGVLPEHRNFHAGPLVITLGDDTQAPEVHVRSWPDRGSMVRPGEPIKLEVTATEKESGGPWQTGVERIQVIAEPQGVVVGKPGDYTSFRGKSCGRGLEQGLGKSWERKLEVTYTVPPDPPAVIRLCPVVSDFAGNEEGTYCGEFRTTDRCPRGFPSRIADAARRGKTWGTWTGTVKHKREYAVYRAYDGQVLGTGGEDWEITISSFESHEYEGIPGEKNLGFPGRSKGKYEAMIVRARETNPGSRDSALETHTYNLSGDVHAYGDLQSRNAEYRIKFEYPRRPTTPDQSPPHPPYIVQGWACSDRSILAGSSGSITGPDGRTEWTFAYTPGEPPQHERLRARLERDMVLVAQGSGVYKRLVELELPTIAAEFIKQHKMAEREKASGSYRVIKESHDEVIRTFNTTAQELRKRHDTANRLWNRNASDSEYSTALQAIRDTVTRWRASKQSITERSSRATYDIGTEAERVTPDRAKELTELWRKLANEGFESFASGN